MRFATALFLAATASASLGFAHAQSTDDSLRIYAVNIVQDPPQSWTGYGIYLRKRPSHHRRPCRWLGLSHQTERAHRGSGPACDCNQGRLFRAGGPDAPFY